MTQTSAFTNRLSMNEVTTFRWSFGEDVSRCSEAGYTSIGIWLHKLIDYGEERAVDLLADSRLRVSNALWAGGFTGSDGRSLEESVDDAIRLLRLSAAAGAGCLVVYTGGRNNHTFRHAGRLVRAALDELLPVAEACEVPLALEPMHPAAASEWTFLTDLEVALDFVEEFQTPYLKLVYDTFHFPRIAEQSQLWRRLVSHLAVVHLGDRRTPPSIDQERCLLGEGDVPLAGIVAALVDAGYQGDFDVELMGQEVEATCYDMILAESRETFAALTAGIPHHAATI